MATTHKPPTVKQMVSRSNSGHVRALARLSAGLPVVPEGAPRRDVRGWQTVYGTLLRWRAVEAGGVVTDIGRELLTAYEPAFPTVLEQESLKSQAF